jgi:hypothetical protein
MLTGAESFGDGFKSIWKSILSDIQSILSSWLESYFKSWLARMLGMTQGTGQSLSGALLGSLTGGSGGGTGGINTGTLVNMFGGGAGAGVLSAGGAGGMGAGITATEGGLLLPTAGSGLGTAGVGVGGIGTTGGATGSGASGSATAGLGGAAAIGAGVLGAGLLGGAVAGKGGAITGSVAAGVGGAALLGSGALTASTIGGSLALGAATFGIGAAAVGAYVLIKHYMSTAGRDAVQKFVSQNFGNYDNLHARLNTLHDQLQAAGYDSEQLWIMLTQGVGRGNAKEAAKAIQTVTDALNKAGQIEAVQKVFKAAGDAVQAWQDLSASGTASAEDLQAAWQAAEEAIAATGDANLQSLTKAHDAATQQIADLDAQIKSLQDSVDQEAPEEVMGVIETQQRAQLDALKKERDEAAKHLEDVTKALQDAITDALSKIPDEINIRVNTQYTATGNGNGSEGRPGSGPTSTTEPTGEPTRYASTGGLVSRMGQVLPFPVVPVQHFDKGGIARFIPRGADTVPAMLSPGETIRTPIQEATLSHLLDMAIGVIDTMHQMPVAVGAETYSGHTPSTIIMQVNGRELGRATAVVLPGETRRLGVKVVRR